MSELPLLLCRTQPARLASPPALLGRKKPE